MLFIKKIIQVQEKWIYLIKLEKKKTLKKLELAKPKAILIDAKVEHLFISSNAVIRLGLVWNSSWVESSS